LFLYFMNSAGTQLEKFSDDDVPPALQAFAGEYLYRSEDSSDLLHDQLETQNPGHLTWTSRPEDSLYQ